MKTLLSAAFVIAALLGGCARLASRPLVQDTLYFGMQTPQGQVTEEEWAAFLEKEATPRFGDGFTVWNAQGQWKNSGGDVIKEPTKVMQIVHPDSKEAELQVAALILAYKARFRQESVLRAKARAEFSY